MFLRTLQITAFRLLEDVRLEFAPRITVLIGPNNAGKSNVVDCLLFLKEVTTQSTLGTALSTRQGFERVVSHHNIQRTISIEATLRNQTEATYAVTFDANGISGEHAVTDLGQLRVERESQSLWLRRPDGSGVGGFDVWHSPMQSQSPPEYEPIREFFLSMEHVDPFRLVNFQEGIGTQVMVHPSGADLARVLHYHYNNDREGFDAFEETVKRVLPEVEMIETPISQGQSATISARFVGDSEKYNLWQVSSGVKDALVLLAAIHFSKPGSLLLIEEPENHLHPASQKALSVVIREASEQEAKQFIITTHSEVILGQFDPENVIFVDKQDASAKATPMAEADLYFVWQRLGIERTLLLQILARAPQVIAIVEGRDDYQTLDPLWDQFDLRDKVLPATSGGGGWQEIVDSAQALAESLKRFRLPTRVFVLLDNDGEREAKIEYLRAHGFEDDDCHVWLEKEIESYLALPTALAHIAGRTADEVRGVIESTSGRGKESLEAVLAKLGIAGIPKHVIVRNALANRPEEIPEELTEVPRKIRRVLGMDRR